MTLVFAALGFSGAAEAQEWRWSVTPYAWAATVGVNVSINDHEAFERDADLGDVLDSLDFIAEAHVEGQKGRHGLFFDGSYFNLGDDEHHFDFGPLGDAVVKGDLEMTILETGGIYNPNGDGNGFTLIYGVRVLDLDEAIDLSYDFAFDVRGTRRYSATATFVDGMLGARYAAPLSERWAFILRADASAGSTEVTWNAWTGLGWAFGAARQNALYFGYRYMEIEFQEDDERAEVESQVKLAGFITGIKFGF